MSEHKCPVCVSEGLKSRTTHGPTHVTLAGSPRFTDEEGVTHHHDRNVNTAQYRCSRGHRWKRSYYRPCPGCGKVSGEEVVEILQSKISDFDD
jgi:hypothetical protein